MSEINEIEQGTQFKQILYPFSAIVGQEDMKRSLILNAIEPAIGGVLIKGEKGTAKSTAVRALAAILPPLEIDGSASMQVVELPINATEDRVVGTIDLEYALTEGKKKFEPGILAKANNNILYVDEINLLDDHVVDVLLDAAAMGINTVEREGISYSHPAKFILVGTMNPEEGDIRPQLLDRFGLSVDVKGEREPESRMEVVWLLKVIKPLLRQCIKTVSGNWLKVLLRLVLYCHKLTLPTLFCGRLQLCRFVLMLTAIGRILRCYILQKRWLRIMNEPRLLMMI